MTPVVVSLMDAVFSIVRKIYEREPTDNMKDLNVNTTV